MHHFNHWWARAITSSGVTQDQKWVDGYYHYFICVILPWYFQPKMKWRFSWRVYTWLCLSSFSNIIFVMVSYKAHTGGSLQERDFFRAYEIVVSMTREIKGWWNNLFMNHVFIWYCIYLRLSLIITILILMYFQNSTQNAHTIYRTQLESFEMRSVYHFAQNYVEWTVSWTPMEVLWQFFLSTRT